MLRSGRWGDYEAGRTQQCDTSWAIQDRVLKQDIGPAPPNFTQLDMEIKHGVVHAPTTTCLAGLFILSLISRDLSDNTAQTETRPRFI